MSARFEMPVSWGIQGTEKVKYENIFNSLEPVGGKLTGDKVRPVLLNSKLSVEILGKVWELSDIDNDGFLDKEEFCVAMHLVYRAIEKEPVPSVLPPNLIPPSKQNLPATAIPVSSTSAQNLPGSVYVLPPSPSSPVVGNTRHNSATSSLMSPKLLAQQTTVPPVHSQWIVNAADRTRFSTIFQQKRQQDGYIGGVDARDIFVQSGLPQPVLAHIWNMCDQQKLGRLNQEQFVLAMHLISQRVKGIDPPAQLTPEILSIYDSTHGDGGGSLPGACSGLGDSASIRELDSLTQEIEELRKEKEALTTEVQKKEAAIKSSSHDVQELQDKLDRDSSTLAQLESDKSEAHTRLEELDQQRTTLDSMLADVRLKVQEETENIKSLRAQLSAQAANVGHQENELRKVRTELAELQKEEIQLGQRLEAGKQQHAKIENSIKYAKSDMEKVQAKIRELQEEQKSVNCNIEQYDKAISTIRLESENTELTFDANKSQQMMISESVFSMGGMQEKIDDLRKDLNEDAFNKESGEDPFNIVADPFANNDPFDASDPFSTGAASIPSSDPFGVGDSPSTEPVDPFTGADPFAADIDGAAKENEFAAVFAKSPADSGSLVDPFSPEPTVVPNAANHDSFTTKNLDTTTSSFATDPFNSSNSGPFLASTVQAKPSPAGDGIMSDTSTSFATTLQDNAVSTFNADSLNSHVFSSNVHNTTTNDDFFAFPSSSSFTTEAIPTKTEANADPWGSAFPTSANMVSSSALNDPFGADTFGFATSSSNNFATFSAHPFATSVPDKCSANVQKTAPPRPVKPSEFSVITTTQVHKNKGKSKAAKLTEAEQLAWAQKESKRAEDERRTRQEEQEKADLELAIALSKQEG